MDHRNGDFDIYAQRVDASGVTKWTTDGVAICTANGDQADSTLTSDGSGGAIVIWVDYRSSKWDIYAQRVDVSGVTQWAPNGVGICTVVSQQEFPGLIRDQSGGAIITWMDDRNGIVSCFDVYAQRIDKNGNLGKTPRGIPWLLLLLDD
jgi:hypothetical protein